MDIGIYSLEALKIIIFLLTENWKKKFMNNYGHHLHWHVGYHSGNYVKAEHVCCCAKEGVLSEEDKEQRTEEKAELRRHRKATQETSQVTSQEASQEASQEVSQAPNREVLRISV